MEYGYNGLGRRTHRTQGTSRTDYWYDASGMSLESGGTNATYLRDPGGKLLSSWTGGVLQNYATDKPGSVTATTNNTSGDRLTPAASSCGERRWKSGRYLNCCCYIRI